MAKPLRELGERLLQAGVAPRHVRRYLNELTDHLADLRAEEEGRGRCSREAEMAALTRLGVVDELAQALIKRRQFQSWCARAPWAIFSLGSLLTLAGAYFVACLYLWCGWKAFVPGADTPFGSALHPIYSVANVYFQAGRFWYYSAPILVGWGIGVIAARQRLRVLWPVIGLVLNVCTGATAQIHASRSAVSRGLGHISINFFNLGSSSEAILSKLIYAAVILSLSMLPYFIWRRPRVSSLSE